MRFVDCLVSAWRKIMSLSTSKYRQAVMFFHREPKRPLAPGVWLRGEVQKMRYRREEKKNVIIENCLLVCLFLSKQNCFVIRMFWNNLTPHTALFAKFNKKIKKGKKLDWVWLKRIIWKTDEAWDPHLPLIFDDLKKYFSQPLQTSKIKLFNFLRSCIF